MAIKALGSEGIVRSGQNPKAYESAKKTLERKRKGALPLDKTICEFAAVCFALDNI